MELLLQIKCGTFLMIQELPHLHSEGNTVHLAPQKEKN